MKSLAGRTILVTRPREQADELRAPLEALGARVAIQPAIEIVPPEDWAKVDSALEKLEAGEFDWVVFSSANGVRFVLERAAAIGRADAFRGVKLATVGSGTSRALRAFGLGVDLEPKTFDAEGIFAALIERCDGALENLRFLSFRASRGRKVLAESLTSRGAVVSEVEAYRSVDVESPDPEIARLMRDGMIDCATAMSSATAKSLAKMFGSDAANARWIALSPLTADALRSVGLEVAAIAEQATTLGLVDAVVRYFEER